MVKRRNRRGFNGKSLPVPTHLFPSSASSLPLPILGQSCFAVVYCYNELELRRRWQRRSWTIWRRSSSATTVWFKPIWSTAVRRSSAGIRPATYANVTRQALPHTRSVSQVM
jgi:hypothetical protein